MSISISSADPETTQVFRLLTRGRKDLSNAPIGRGFSSILLSPVRRLFLDPLFGISTIFLPRIAILSPGLDSALASCVTFHLYCLSYFYTMMGDSSAASSEANNGNLRAAARNDILRHPARQMLPKFQPPSDLVSAFHGAVAFSTSAFADVVSVFMDRKKMSAWFNAVAEFKAYLDVSGVGSELEEAISKPLKRGRLLDNVKILNDIQEIMYVDRCERIASLPNETIFDPLEKGKRMMRFATAAYGTNMIRSALDREARPHELESQLKAIAFHCNIPPQDIKILFVDDGGDMKVLRHFVAVDHSAKQVVLALRGTLSISGALIDMQGMACDYCGCGKAHKGIAEMADNIWAQSGARIVELFESDNTLKDYTFVITGHSLGAGAACLLNLKCYTENLLGDRPVQCFGFAPPPTWCSSPDTEESTAVKKAIENTLCYIHDNDCVPLLSVRCIRRLANLMDTVDNRTEHIWAYRRFRIFWEWDSIPNDIVADVKAAEALKELGSKTAPKLIIPAKMVVWMKRRPTGSYEGFGCDPQTIADMNIFCCEDMISDHLVESYEDALDELVASNSNT